MSALRTGLIGKKLGMTQIFTEQGDRLAVTAIQAAGNVVVAKRTMEKDGYTAVQIGFGEKPLRLCNKPQLGHFTKAGVAPQRVVREMRVTPADLDKFEVGKPVPVDQIFKTGTYVDVIGTSKGKGFQGVMKRHHMPGFRATHGTHEFFRHGGSIGCRLTPGRVHRGKRMSGHMGDVRRMVQNLAIVDVLVDQGVILVEGSVPGGKNGIVMLKNATKRTGAVKSRTYGEVQEKSKNPMKASKAAAASAKKK
ncbi:MAG TPA: 50S ribosomal protein L3 [Polyangia bacterium]|nr:50S ribosomal protein L3 [Polyangia bacterium]